MMWMYGDMLAASGSFYAGPLIMGILMVVALGFVAIFYGLLRRGRERQQPIRRPERPLPRSGAWQTPSEVGKEPVADHGPGHQDGEPTDYEEATRTPEEVPRDGRRRMPYELRDYPGPRTS
jgi:hypothetical protein